MAKLADTLIVIDMQKALRYSYNFNDLINRINRRITLYREENLPIIFIQHHDKNLVLNSDLWQLTKNLDAKKEDLKLNKTHYDAFYHTDLQKNLQEKNIKTIEICGAQTEYCCNTTITVAHNLGYKIQLKHDATTTFDNNYMTAEDTISFFENIWDEDFVTFV
ncbi:MULTISPECIES: cysteine hydrolase family protein [unclassified Companilactobacillus]|jgi:nicotinamidase-related amidase|uniref:cysteine hydrolase family protein n=1 Tax=unclassified Companilactobacillus TaxID=2767904 RepID=UPI002FF3234C